MSDSMTEVKDAHLAADVVLFADQEGVRHVLLVKRRWKPFKDRWALPGGYLKPRERFHEAAWRELHEETGVDMPKRWEEVGLYDQPDRDPRGRVVTRAFAALLPVMVEPRAGDDAREARWFPVDEALGMGLAFDHRDILNDALLVIGYDDEDCSCC